MKKKTSHPFTRKQRMKLSKSTRMVYDGLYLTMISKRIFGLLKPGSSLTTIADKIEEIMRKDKYIIYPISFEIESFSCNSAPLLNNKLREDSVISFTLQIMGHKWDKVKNRFPLKCSYTVSLNGKNYKSLLNVVNLACSDGIKKCGPDVKLINVRDVIVKRLEDGIIVDKNSSDDIEIKKKHRLPIKSLMNQYSINLENPDKIIPSTKRISNELRNKVLDSMRSRELYYINVYGTNLPKHDVARTFQPFPTMFILPDFRNVRKEYTKLITFIRKKHKKCLRYYNMIIKWFRVGEPFSLRELRTKYKDKTGKNFALSDIQPLHNVDLIRGIPAMYVEYNYSLKAKRSNEIKNILKKLKNQAKSADSSNIKKLDIDIERLETESKELKVNNAVVVHFGHTVLITDTGKQILC